MFLFNSQSLNLFKILIVTHSSIVPGSNNLVFLLSSLKKFILEGLDPER